MNRVFFVQILINKTKDMYAAIAGAAVSALGSVLASKQAAKEKEERDALIKQKEARINNQINYANRDRSQDATNVNLLNQGRAISQEMINRAEGMNAVGNGSEAAIATAKQAAAKQNADTVASAVVNSETARQSDLASLNGQQNEVENLKINNKNADISSAVQKGNNFQTAGSGLISADANSYLNSGKGVFQSMFGKKTVTTGVK